MCTRLETEKKSVQDSLRPVKDRDVQLGDVVWWNKPNRRKFQLSDGPFRVVEEVAHNLVIIQRIGEGGRHKVATNQLWKQKEGDPFAGSGFGDVVCARNVT